MAHRSDPTFLVLHALRLRGGADTDAVSLATGIAPVEIERALAGLATGGLVEHRQAAPAGWRLTPAGQSAHRRLVDDDLEVGDIRSRVEEAHRRFVEVNPDLLAACTAWQLRDVEGARVANDHTDAAYDQAVVEQLVEVHRRIVPVLDDLGSHLDRFSRYAPRLQAALDHVVAGRGDWFTRPLLDSYHSAWFELHQDLLDTLAIERASEAVSA